MSQVAKQFERVQRVFLRVLDDKDRTLSEYEDDAWNFFQNCWHLKDWIENDRKGVAKATRGKIKGEVNSHPALVLVGELARKSPHLEVRSTITGGDNKTHGDILMKVVDEDGEELLVKALATDAMKNWMAIIRKYRI
jgi:hypothetical protein